MKQSVTQNYRPLRRRYFRGYALLVTLVMLGLLGVILGGLARISADTALEAREAEDRLRRHWAELSCQRALLVSAPEWSAAKYAAWVASFDDDARDANSDAPRPAGQESLHLSLTGVELWIRIEDEQAKVNLNHLLREASADGDTFRTESVLRDALGGVSGVLPQVTRPEMVQALGLEPLESWGQALPGSTPGSLLGVNAPKQLLGGAFTNAITGNKTLWGSGQINLVTAQEQVVIDHLRDRVPPETVQRLLQAHREDPSRSLHALIAEATDDPDERAALATTLTTRSHCFSMWLASRPAARPTAIPHWSLHIVTSGSNATAGTPANIRQYRW